MIFCSFSPLIFRPQRPSLDTRRWLYFQKYFNPHRHDVKLCPLVSLNLKVIHNSLNCNHREIPFDVRTQSLRFTNFMVGHIHYISI